MVDHVRGESDPVMLLQSVPGIGERLAEMIHYRLHIDSLEQLEQAVHDGRLLALAPVAKRRAASIGAAVASMLGRPYEHVLRAMRDAKPRAAALVAVDREYRARAALGDLELVAPRRFNPDAAAWLPILHTRRGDWRFTAMYSNTALAHRLGRTHDWVVVYFYAAGHVEHCRTIVTEHQGPMAGRRVVRGLEDECLRLPRERRRDDGTARPAHAPAQRVRHSFGSDIASILGVTARCPA
jgi:DNA polymerase (family 10)